MSEEKKIGKYLNKSSKEPHHSYKNLREKFEIFEVPEFQKKMMGYHPEDVDHYLNALLDAYTKLYDECEAFKEEAAQYRMHKEKIAHALIKSQMPDDFYGSELPSANSPVKKAINIDRQVERFWIE